MEVLKTQKEKDITARTTILIKPSLITALRDTAPALADEALDPQQAPQPEPARTNTLELID